MNKKYIILWIVCAGVYPHLDARIGCLDNSYNLERPVDYKNWHIVKCNCACERAYKILEGNICEHCHHRLTSIPMNAYNETIDAQKTIASVNIAALRKKAKNRHILP